MGLIKSISVNRSGIYATYWSLSRFELNMESNYSNVTMAGYLTMQHYLDGFAPIMHIDVKWSGADNPITAQAMQAGQGFALALAKLIAPTPPSLTARPNPFEGAVPA